MTKIKIGFVGAGWMGSTQMQRLCEHNDAEIVALFEKNTERGKEVLKNLGLSEDLLVDDYSQMVSNPNIDAAWLVSVNGGVNVSHLAGVRLDAHRTRNHYFGVK